MARSLEEQPDEKVLLRQHLQGDLPLYRNARSGRRSLKTFAPILFSLLVLTSLLHVFHGGK